MTTVLSMIAIGVVVRCGDDDDDDDDREKKQTSLISSAYAEERPMAGPDGSLK